LRRRKTFMGRPCAGQPHDRAAPRHWIATVKPPFLPSLAAAIGDDGPDVRHSQAWMAWTTPDNKSGGMTQPQAANTTTTAIRAKPRFLSTTNIAPLFPFVKNLFAVTRRRGAKIALRQWFTVVARANCIWVEPPWSSRGAQRRGDPGVMRYGLLDRRAPGLGPGGPRDDDSTQGHGTLGVRIPAWRAGLDPERLFVANNRAAGLDVKRSSRMGNGRCAQIEGRDRRAAIGLKAASIAALSGGSASVSFGHRRQRPFAEPPTLHPISRRYSASGVP
jgi:hypothetical protein